MTRAARSQNAMQEETPLRVSAVDKRYGDKQVLKDVSLELKAGELFGLIGLNGVGKTTLIKIIIDLASADKGEVSLFGQPSTEVEARRHLSYLPEKFTPSRYLYGREYLLLTCKYYRCPFDLDIARAMAAALDLDPKALDMKVGGYSKGMGQKLGLLGAFLVDQPFLILDEPMSGLDPRARIALKEKLLELKKVGKTIFFSSHILADIDEICDRIGVIHDSELRHLGTPSDFKKAHKEKSLEKAFLKAID